MARDQRHTTPARAREIDGPGGPACITQHDLERTLGYLAYRLGSWQDAEAALELVLMELAALQRDGREADSAQLFEIAHRAELVLARSGRRPRPDPARAAEFARVASIAAAFDVLAPVERRAVLLREWSGLSYREIAAVLGMALAETERLFFTVRGRLGPLEAPAAAGSAPPVALRSA